MTKKRSFLDCHPRIKSGAKGARNDTIISIILQLYFPFPSTILRPIL